MKDPATMAAMYQAPYHKGGVRPCVIGCQSYGDDLGVYERLISV